MERGERNFTRERRAMSEDKAVEVTKMSRDQSDVVPGPLPNIPNPPGMPERQGVRVVATCETCKFLRGNNPKWECRFNPPIGIDLDSSALWPIVNVENDWCSKHEEKGEG